MAVRKKWDKKHVTFYMAEGLKHELEARSDETGQPQSYIVEQALRQYLGAGNSKGGKEDG